LMSAGMEEIENTESWLFKKENEAWLNKAIESLPPQRQMVFRLCKLENKTHEEVSQLLSISKATVNNHLVKAIQNLRSLGSGNTDLAGILLLIWLFE
ncbi:MAG: sigma-70 family RNA polymerase sigma factor, partial [Chitinophagaceae bacterium]|nr:sigma-70 family RNA polymerase sigma factor [Chitinophagaceae bacterium]